MDFERSAEFSKRKSKTSINEYSGRVYPASAKVPYTIEDSVIADRRADSEMRAGIAAKRDIEVSPID